MKDIDIRQQLKEDLKKKKFVINDPQCKIYDEFGLCQGSSRIDVVVINGHFHGYEIKSEQDTLQRLNSQLSIYSKTLDYLTVVANMSHILELEEVLPKWVGITIALQNKDGTVSLKPIRKASKNKLIDPYAFVQLLWKDEAYTILRDLGLEKGMKSKSRTELWNKLASSMPIIQLHQIVRDTIKQREWRAAV